MLKTHFIKTIASLLMFLLLPLRADAQVLYFDVNGDGEVNIADINAIIDYIIRGGEAGEFPGTDGFLSAADYGAVGDGVADDTPALESLFADAYEKKLAVYIPAGVYLIRRPLTIKSGMEIYGDGANSIIKKKAAVWSQLAEAAEECATTLHLKDVSGFSLGDHFFITKTTSATNPAFVSARDCSYGEITEIDYTNNSITFVSAFEGVKTGTVKTHAKNCYVSTSFPILRSWSCFDDCIGVYIHDICLDGNRQDGEPMEWTNACIHFDPFSTIPRNGITYDHHTYNHTLERCKLINASFDGISDQGEGGLYVSDCIIENCAMHGIHMGTTFTNAVITNNKMTGNRERGAGVFCCQSVTNVIVDNNQIKEFNHGCSDEEYGSAGKFLIIRNNVFRNITSSVFDFMKANNLAHGGGLQITNNYIDGLKALMFEGNYIDDVIISNNVVRSVANTPSNVIRLANSSNIMIVGNKLPASVSVSEPVIATETENLMQNSNTWDN